MFRLFNILFTTISILLLSYVLYKSEVVWKGNAREYYFIYYIISIILVTLSASFFFINKILRTYIFIIFLSVVSTLYLFEAYLNLPYAKYADVRDKIKLYKKEGKNFDTRTIREIYNELKKDDINTSVKVSPLRSVKIKDKGIQPLSGVSNSKTIYDNENGYFFIYNSDRYGFNNPDYEWDSEEIEYLLIGDSFAHGAAVNKPDDIASQLRKFSSKSVITLGYSANGPLLEYASLREYGYKNVKKIIWIFCDNDIPGLGYELKSEILLKYLEDLNFTQNLKSRQEEVDELARKIIKNKKFDDNTFNLLRFLKLIKIRGQILNNKIEENYSLKNPATFIKVITLAKEYAKKNNSEFHFVYLPYKKFFDDKYDENIYLSVKEIIKNLNVNFIDINEVFNKEDNPQDLFPFKKYGHYNVDGYHKVSKEIFIRTTEK
jgi:hypothetical protein